MDGLGEQPGVAVAVGGIELAQRDIGLIAQCPERRQRPRAIPQVEEADPALACEQPGHPRLAHQPGQLLVSRRAGSVVTDGDLPHPQYLGDQHDVRLHRAGEGLDRQVIGAGVHEGAHPGGAKLPHLAEHLGRGTGQAVGAERRHQRGDPRPERLPGGELGGTKGETALPATAGDVGEGIHQTRHQVAAATVHPHQRPAVRHGQSLAYPGDAAIGHQQILLPQMGWAVEFGTLDQGQHHGYSSQSGSWHQRDWHPSIYPPLAPQ
ncbi:hypothetical protein D3C79_643550 [compost metagenome]